MKSPIRWRRLSGSGKQRIIQMAEGRFRRGRRGMRRREMEERQGGKDE
jgi:hypothetical protein